MAEKLDTYVFQRGNSPYPWNEWLDGSIWRLVQGVDFLGDRRAFQTQIYRKASAHGLHARISKREDGVIVMQAYRAAGEGDA